MPVLRPGEQPGRPLLPGSVDLSDDDVVALWGLMYNIARERGQYLEGGSTRWPPDGCKYWRDTLRGPGAENAGALYRVWDGTSMTFQTVDGSGNENADGALWTELVEAALHALRHGPQSVDWCAYLYSPIHWLGHGQALERDFAVSPTMNLEPMADPYCDFVYTEALGRSSAYCWPIKVTGVADARCWQEVEHRLNNELHVLCSLITLAFNHRWRVLKSPKDYEWDPTLSLGPAAGVFAQSGRVLEPKPRALPEWLADAFARTMQETPLREALLMFMEGMSLEPNHGSFALVAYLSAIQSIGAGPPVRGTRRKKFNAIVGEVMDPERTEHLARAYGTRSDIVHQAALYAGEGGYAWNNYMAQREMATEPSVFSYVTVEMARVAFRRCFLNVIGVSRAEWPEFSER